jgi:hypothetical protein
VILFLIFIGDAALTDPFGLALRVGSGGSGLLSPEVRSTNPASLLAGGDGAEVEVGVMHFLFCDECAAGDPAVVVTETDSSSSNGLL